MRARLIYNPTSGQEIIKKYIAEILNRLESYGYETSAFQTTIVADSARIEAERACKTGKYDLIIAAGGDGTIQQVVSGLVSFKRRPKLALIPTGTTNDFARALKIPRGKPLEAVELIGKAQTLKIDIGRAVSADKSSYFINIAATGALSELTYSVPSNLKTAFGYLAYLAKGVELLPRVKKAPVLLTTENETLTLDASMIFVALTNSVGGFETLAPDAKLDDGKFTVIVVKTDNLFEILGLLGMVAAGKGQHMTDKNIAYFKTQMLEIKPLSDKKILVNLDGEFGGAAPIRFENLQGALELFVNLDAMPDENYIGEDDVLAYEAVAQKFAEQTEHLKDEQ
jgi:diacylglycerol kinase (ATP)